MSHQSHSCFYCQEISLFEDDYPLRLGSFTSERIIFRCSWHSQFKCASCNNFYHFSWLYWCPKTNKTICGRCNNPTLTPVKFWKRTYTYTFFCSDCNETHYDLLYSEFRGLHPWQQSIHLQAELSQSKSTKDFVITPILSHHHPWFPIWSPETVRIGKSISLEEALAIPDNVHPIREAITSHSVGIHSPLIPESDISLSDSESRWTKNTSKWIESYSKTSDDDQGDFSRQLIIDPELSQIIGKAEGLRVLDAGCGNGYLARKLAREGAEVVGVDYSQKFIEYCILQEEQTLLGCSYYQGSLTDLSFLEDNSFDLVVSNVVFIDVVNFKLAFKEISRVLKNHGRFIWSNIHPVFGRMGHVSYRLPFDTKRNEEKLYSMVDRYFDSGGYLVSWGSLEPLWQIDRTLTEYSTALYENHFLIRRIVEPKPSLQNIQKFPAFLAFDADRIPNFIIFDCVKMEKSS